MIKILKIIYIYRFNIQKILIVPQKKGLIILIFDLIFLTDDNKH